MANTGEVFRAFLVSSEKANGFAPPGILRLNSSGGSLGGGMSLGFAIRENKFSTEVGSSELEKGDGREALYDRSQGSCVSACAYAYLGGIDRTLDPGARLGFHQFYDGKALEAPAARLYSGKDLDEQQRIMSAIVLYVIQMGVDPRLVVVASDASATEMRYLEGEDARKLRVTYEPNVYKPWHVEAYKGGAIAVAESNDGLKTIVASCSKRYGPNVTLIYSKPAWDVASWFEQCRTMNPEEGHHVFGAFVSPDKVKVTRRKDGVVMMRFQLPSSNPPLNSSSFLSFDDGYPRACSTADYLGTTENFSPTVRLAFRNCIQEDAQ